MLKLSHQDIARLCADSSIFMRGARYYNRGAVTELHCSEELDHVEARVRGTKEYYVEIFEDEGSVNYFCSCPAFANYEGFCKHIVAVLLTLSGKKPSALLKLTGKGLVDDLLHTYSSRAAGDSSLKEVELGVTLRFSQNDYRGSRTVGSAALTMGERGARKYVVRDIDKLITAIVNEEPLYFGKRFSYDPARHNFSPGSRRALDFFIRIHEIERSQGSYYYTGILKGKEFGLTTDLLRRLLAGLEELPFTLQLGSRFFNGVEVRKTLPLQFQLLEDKNELTLKLSDAGEIKPLTDEADILLYKGQIYSLAGTAQAALLPLLRTVMEQKNAALQVGAAQEQSFFSGLYPVIEKTAAMEISPAVEKRLYRPPLQARVYLDYDRGEVAARLEFIYGKITIDPFATATAKEDPPEAGRPLLIRDPAAEQRVMRFFEEAEFTVRGGSMYLEDEERIWTFVFENIPGLQQLAEVYYSERFKQAGRKAPRFTGRVGIDWSLDLLELNLGLEGISPEELAEIWQSLKIKRRYHRLRDGSMLPLEGEGIEQFTRLAGALELQPADLKQEIIRLPKYQALYLDHLVSGLENSPIEESKELAGLVRRIRNPAASDYPLPPPLEGVLRDYQVTGFKWLKSLAQHGLGGILADDMGLGKTLQAIAFILSGRQNSKPQLTPPPALVVAPASLIYNWEAEIKKFAPQLRALVVAGTKQERQELFEAVDKADVVITSYPLLRRDIAAYAGLSFSCCMLDEAQYIKNPNSLTAQCARRLRTPQRFALTGTPMENSLTELWSIFQFIMPGYLQSHKKFMQKYGDAGAALEAELPGGGAVPLAAKVRPFILRRLKEEVLSELPPKIEHRFLSELSADQKKIYLAYLERLRSESSKSIQDGGFNRSRIQILAGLMRLRQICCHPALFLENYRGESAKLLQLQELLREAIDGGHRILLFSQFTGMLQLIRTELDRGGYRYFYLDGSTGTAHRLQMVNSFNGGEREIFLISLKAGGTGLNLTGADIVIQYDLWWNPAVEEQAAGRAHRIGQKKIVQVIRLLAKDTIEEKIFELQQKKKELIDKVIQPGETFLSTMSESDIREILEI